jgi:predicted nuclease of predicted toxin-antitoxin system
LRFLLDEDLPPRAAEIGRGLDLDVASVHELDRRGYTDREQLLFAAKEGRVFVTRDRKDFVELTLDFYRAGVPHPGVLIVGHVLPNDRPERIAHALKRWEESRSDFPESFGLYVVGFLP